tara:strand:- start:565 stop:1620 length:1056 start_codon:yes stop_codon:yes gene_type:complete
MEFSAAQLSELLSGTIEGDPNSTVNTLSQIDDGKANSISFLYNPEYKEHLYTTKASIVILNSDFAIEKGLPETLTVIRVEDARLAFAKILEAYQQFKQNKSGIHPSAIIEASAEIGENVYIGPFVYVAHGAKVGDNTNIAAHSTIGEKAKVGANCILHYNVTINEESVIGNHCILQSGVVIGGDGFGFQPNQDNNYTKIIHIGNVIVEDHVEIGANTTIDRGTLGSTIIRKGVKLDNLIQIAHNVEIDENTVIASQTGVAGSTYIGKNCMIGGQVGFEGHQRIEDGVKIAAKSGVPKKLAKGNGIYQGIPAFPIHEYQRSYVFFRKLPELNNQISDLKKELKELRDKLGNH